MLKQLFVCKKHFVIENYMLMNDLRMVHANIQFHGNEHIGELIKQIKHFFLQ